MRFPTTSFRVTRRRAIVAIGAVLLAAFAVDVAFAFYSETADTSERGPEIVWPVSPDAPRIRYVRSITSPNDLKLKKSSLFKRIVRKVVGLSDANTMLVAPYGITTDSRNRLIVADPKGAAVHVFDVAGKKYTKIEAPKGESFVS